ncbi:hypothetical protein [Marinobacter shengliensis]|uniref:hypothetical protein n=1 Tax=Marinobacter shengliensis TaxID=1389223 RepID=UPI001E33E9A8|nr:hypothetical protein [Marinobacter shengliensis]MCD1631914.1 hypothetical protein [Marinobacter shengliensis]
MAHNKYKRVTSHGRKTHPLFPVHPQRHHGHCGAVPPHSGRGLDRRARYRGPTLVLTGFACAYIAMSIPRDNASRGTVVLIGAALAFFEPWQGLLLGVVATPPVAE